MIWWKRKRDPDPAYDIISHVSEVVLCKNCGEEIYQFNKHDGSYFWMHLTHGSMCPVTDGINGITFAEPELA